MLWRSGDRCANTLTQLNCHPERSEGSALFRSPGKQAQDDNSIEGQQICGHSLE